MRLIFSLVANLTYTLFCSSISFVILHLYRILCFPALYMLSSSLAVFTLYNSVLMYGVCILLLVCFDVDTFRSQSDIASDTSNVTAPVGVARDDSTQFADGVPATPAEDCVAVYREQHVNTLISLLLCHLTVFFAVLAIFFVCLCECIYVKDSTLCNMALGNHSANHAIGIALILLTISTVVPLFHLYKLNAGTSPVLYENMPTLVVFFTCLMHITILSKFVFYSASCPLLVSFSGSLLLAYLTIVLHFGVRFGDLVVCSVLSTTPPARHMACSNNTYSNFAILACNTALLLGNLAYAWNISMVFNIVQSTVILGFILLMSHRIVSVPAFLYKDKVL